MAKRFAVRNVDAQRVAALECWAARNRRSAQAEHREILREGTRMDWYVRAVPDDLARSRLVAAGHAIDLDDPIEGDVALRCDGLGGGTAVTLMTCKDSRKLFCLSWMSV